MAARSSDPGRWIARRFRCPGVVFQVGGSRLTSAVSAAKELISRLHAVTDYPAAAMVTSRREP